MDASSIPTVYTGVHLSEGEADTYVSTVHIGTTNARPRASTARRTLDDVQAQGTVRIHCTRTTSASRGAVSARHIPACGGPRRAATPTVRVEHLARKPDLGRRVGVVRREQHLQREHAACDAPARRHHVDRHRHAFVSAHAAVAAPRTHTARSYLPTDSPLGQSRWRPTRTCYRPTLVTRCSPAPRSQVVPTRCTPRVSTAAHATVTAPAPRIHSVDACVVHIDHARVCTATQPLHTTARRAGTHRWWLRIHDLEVTHQSQHCH